MRGKLVRGAAAVDRTLICSDCISKYLQKVFAAIRERVRYDFIMDDREAFVRLAETVPGACDDFREVKVVVKRHGKRFRAVGTNGLCETLRRAAWTTTADAAPRMEAPAEGAAPAAASDEPFRPPLTGAFVVP